MATRDFDLFVIGAGSGGVRAARFSADRGARVAVAEDRYLGGTCVNVGCVPKKLFVYASHFRAEMEDATRGFGWSVGDVSFDWRTLRDNKTREIERLNGIYDGLLSNAGVQHVEGRATIVDPHTVEVGREALQHGEEALQRREYPGGDRRLADRARLSGERTRDHFE